MERQNRKVGGRDGGRDREEKVRAGEPESTRAQERAAEKKKD